MWGFAHNAFTFNFYIPLGWDIDTGQGIKNRGLTSAVRADQPYQLIGTQGEIEFIDSSQAAKTSFASRIGIMRHLRPLNSLLYPYGFSDFQRNA